VEIFSELGVPVIDADSIAYDLVQPGQPALKEIINLLGHEFLTNDGYLDRKHLRSTAFHNNKIRKTLENILHPLAFKEIDNKIVSIKEPYCIICIPLLLETNAINRVDRILVVDLPEQLQFGRASKRDNVELSEILKIVQNQVTRDERLNKADDLIHNDRDKEYLHEQVNNLHERYLAIASTDDIASSS
jgi:dephospho-CoA kinase